MAEATVDQLQIEIGASSEQAVSQIDKVTGALQRLKGALQQGGMGGISETLRDIGDAAGTVQLRVSPDSGREVEALTQKVNALRNAVSGVNAAQLQVAIGEGIQNPVKPQKMLPEWEISDASMQLEVSPSSSVEVEELTGKVNALQDAVQEVNSTSLKLPDVNAGREPRYEETDASANQKVPERMVEASGGFSLKGILSSAKEVKQQLDGMLDTPLQGTTGKLDGLSKAFKALQSSGGLSLKSLGPLAKSFSSSLMSVGKAHPVLLAMIVALKAAHAVFKNYQAFAQKTFSAVGAGLDFVKSRIKDFGSSLKGLATGAAGKFASGIKAIGAALGSKLAKPFTGTINAISRLKRALKGVLLYRALQTFITGITQGIQQGIKNLYEYSRVAGTEFAPSMDRIATSAQYLKNSLGAMAAPLINALAPVVDMLIDKFVALLNVIGKVFAVLTGKSVYTQAKKQAVEYGAAAGAASKATKDFLLGIDELNVIRDDAGGGGGGGAGFGDMFEEVDIPLDEYDWAQKMREAIEKGDWRGAGEILANKLNEMLDAWDSYAWGKRLGELINNGLNFAYGFLTTFDFEKFGRKIADFFNGLFDTIDWDLLGRTAAAGLNGLFNFIYGFATQLKWATIGLHIATAINSFVDELDFTRAAEAISAFATGIFNLINNAIAGVQWFVLGRRLGEFLNNIDWYGIVNGALMVIVNALNAVKDTINGFLFEWDWRDTAQQIYTAINSAWDFVDWAGLGRSLGNAIKTGLAFVAEVLSGIDWRQIGADIADFLISLDWVGIFGGLTDVAAAGITAAINALGALVDTLAPNLGEIAHGIAQKLNEFFEKIDWKEAGRVLSGGIEAALDFMIEFLQTVDWNAIGQHISEFLENIDWDTLLSKWGQLLGEVMSAKMELIDVSGILDVGANIVKGLWSGMLEEFNAGGGIGGWLKRNVVDILINAVKSLLGIHSPSTVFKEIGRYIVEGLLEGIRETWNSILEFFGTAFEPVTNAIQTAWALVKAVTTGDFATVGAIITGTWDGVNADTETRLAELNGKVQTKWADIGKAADTKFGEAKEAITRNWQEATENTMTVWDGVSETLDVSWETIRALSDTKFGETRDTIGQKWQETQENTDTTWSAVQGSLDTTWETIRTMSDTKFGSIQNSISEKWKATETDTNTVWDSVSKSLDATWEAVRANSDEKFGQVQTGISEKWQLTSSDTDSKWSEINSNLESHWNTTDTNAETDFEKVKNTIGGKWDEANTDADQKWQTINGTLSTSWDQIDTTAESKLSQIASTIAAAWKGIVDDARQWGSDLVRNFSSGMDSGQHQVKTSVRNVGSIVNRNLHFSEPDEGPLSDFHTYAPDMMQLFASGIDDNLSVVKGAVRSVADALSGQFRSIAPEDLNFPVHLEPDASDIRARYSEEDAARRREAEAPDGGALLYTGMRDANGDVVSALYAMGQQLIEAVDRLERRPVQVSVDGRTLMTSVEKQQRKRGADIMGGGVYG